MRAFCKKWIALIGVLTLLIGASVQIQAATVYSVKVSDGSLTVMNGSKTVKAYPLKSTAVTLSGDTAGNLFVCFYNTKGTYSRVKLGQQSTLSVSGEFTSLTMSSTMSPSVSVTLESGAHASSFSVSSDGKLMIAGKIGTLNAGGNAEITLQSGGSVDSAMLSGSRTRLNAPAGTAATTVETFNGATATGAGIGNTSGRSDSSSSNTSGTQSNGVIDLEVDTIYAYDGDRLSDLLGELENNVRAYLVKTGDEVYGTFKWVTPSTTISRTATHSFTFTPDNTRYKVVRGSIRVEIGSGGDSSSGNVTSDVTLKVSTITVKNGQRLRDVTKVLAANVRAYNSRDQRIDGMVSWLDSETSKINEKGSYQFRFSPTDASYDEVDEWITIQVSSTASSSESNNTTDRYGQQLEIISISAASSSKLGDLSDQLAQNVKVYDKDGDRINGSLRWVASSTTAVRNSKLYDFNFTPSSNRYKSMRGKIQIFTDGSSSSSGGGSSGSVTGFRLQISGDITADSDRRRLYEYTEKVESMITAYDARGSRLSGIVEWVDSDTTRVEKTGVYQFHFLPNSSSDTLRGQVRIAVSSTETQLKMPTLNTVSGRRLSDLTATLQNSITLVSNGRTIAGVVDWDLDDSTVISRTGTYSFLFTPNDSQYEPVDESVRITVGVDGGTTARVMIDASDIHISSAKYLYNLTNDLTNSVTIFNENGSRIRGSVRWEDENQYVSKTGSYTFLFTPSDAQYQSVMGDVTISVNRQRSGSNIRLEIVPFEADSNTRLSDLSSELTRSIHAYDSDRNEISGRVSWITSSSTKIRRTAPYQFQFTPSSSRYRSMTGWITIITDE